MISDIFTAITQAVTAFMGTLTSAFSGISALIYTPGSGSDPGQLTFLGVLLIIGLATGVVYWVFSMIRACVYGLTSGR